jgi:flagellar biosynthesis/type III secretory pathway protein FliH
LKLNPAKMQLISGFVDTYLRLNRTEEIEFQQEISSFTQPIKEEVMQITTSWMERGIEQGIERGIEQGVEREKAFILRQLKRKLGKLNQQLEADIIKLNIDDIEALGEALLDFNTVEDLTNWLNSFVS